MQVESKTLAYVSVFPPSPTPALPEDIQQCLETFPLQLEASATGI